VYVVDNENNTHSLDNDSHIKALSPGALTAKRFFRNRLAVAGLVILAAMFLFSFLGGALTPYAQDQVFYRDDLQLKEFAAVTRNEAFRYYAAPEQAFDAVLQAQFSLAVEKQDGFVSGGVTYSVRREGEALYALYDEALVGIAYKDIVTPAKDFDFTYAALTAYTNGRPGFGVYALSGSDVLRDGEEVAHISRLVIQPRLRGAQITKDFREQVEQTIDRGEEQFSYEDNGLTRQFSIRNDAANQPWSVGEETAIRVWDSYAAPSRQHPLGTDKNGMDMLTRLMYGGRVSLVIGFIVVLIAGGVLF
jgi:peptide/nickel transport system permease protein